MSKDLYICLLITTLFVTAKGEINPNVHQLFNGYVEDIHMMEYHSLKVKDTI